MNTIAGHSQPSSRGRRQELQPARLLAGGAATPALIAAGVIVFGSLAAYVAFNALPSATAGATAQADRIAVQVDATADAGAPASAAATLADAAGAVAATPAAASAVAPPPGSAAAAAGTPAGAGAAPGADGTGTGDRNGDDRPELRLDLADRNPEPDLRARRRNRLGR